jgi:hypothetical protein
MVRQGLGAAEGTQMTHSAQQSTAISSMFLKSLLGISFAAVLALAPAPAFAQHGGGGGGGGGSHGGGGGGGSHGGGGGGHASSGSSAAHGTASGTSASTGGHWWNPFHGSNANNGAGMKAGGTGSGANATNSAGANATTRFAAGNNVWQEPPASARTTNAPSHFFASNREGATSAGAAFRRPLNNREFGSASITEDRFRRRIFFPFSPFGFGFGGFGFGFGCDPFWDNWCPGYGFGYGGFGYGAGFGYDSGFGYGGGGYYGAGSDMNFEFNGMDSGAAGEDMPLPEGNAGDWQNAPDNSSQGNVANAQPYVVIFLRDGTSYAVSDYWLAGGKLHYVTSYGGENSVDSNQLDLQRTVNENAAHGVTFTLRPSAATDAPGAPQNSQPSPSNNTQTPAPNPQ